LKVQTSYLLAFQKKIHAIVDNYVLPDPSRKTLYYVINRNGVDQGKVNSQYKVDFIFLLLFSFFFKINKKKLLDF